MNTVNQIELSQVHKINTDKLSYLHADWVVHVMMSHCIDRVHLVLSIEVGIEAIHYHDELVRWFAVNHTVHFLWVNDERAVQAFVNVTPQWRGVTVVKVCTERLSIKFVHKALTGPHLVLGQGTVYFRGICLLYTSDAADE